MPAPARACAPGAGVLYKLGKGFRGRTWNKRFFVVSGQTLAYYSKQEAYEKQERPHKIVDLTNCRVEDTGMERWSGKVRHGACVCTCAPGSSVARARRVQGRQCTAHVPMASARVRSARPPRACALR